MNDIVVPRVKAIIRKKGLKNIAVAERAGYTKNQFSAMMNGRKVMKDIDLQRIAYALEVDANSLFGMESR